jgi:hypothetical protein
MHVDGYSLIVRFSNLGFLFFQAIASHKTLEFFVFKVLLIAIEKVWHYVVTPPPFSQIVKSPTWKLAFNATIKL